MVVLKDLFRLLAGGEFSNLTLSLTPSGNLAEKEYDKVVGHINLGIIEIHKRFKLLENELSLHVTPSVSKYYLRSDRVAAVHNINTTHYIEQPDDDEGCLNIIEVTGVFNSSGEELKINNRYVIPTIQQVAHDVLKITGITVEETFSVIYQSYPNSIIIDEDFDPSEYAIYIPEAIIEPLLYYVAARTYKPMGANDSNPGADKSAYYEQKYELAMQKFDMYGLDPFIDDDENTFEADGWA